MLWRQIAAVFALALGLAWGAGLHAMSVVFISPGKTDESYWRTAAHAMAAAAADLGVTLEVQWAERDHHRQLELARQIAARATGDRPDYVLLSNDYAAGAGLLRILDTAGIKTFMAFSGIDDPQERARLGAPRERFKGWLGSLEPRAEDAGYLTAQALIAHGRRHGARAADGKLHLLAFAGDRSTPSSLRRNEGLARALAEAGDVVLDQLVYAAWSRDKAREQSDWLFQRFPDARLVWAGNDLMAFGAMQSWEQRGGRPGQDAWFSGVNTSDEAMLAVRNARLAALAGGHFLTGAWALVLLHDHHHGHDFANQGLELRLPMFTLFSPEQAARFQRRFGEQRFDEVDFRRFSKVHNSSLKRYAFSLAPLLK